MLITRHVDPKHPADPARCRYLLADGTEVRDAERLRWIASLVIPPAWSAVQIHTTGHCTATGVDAAGRTQYRYSATHLRAARSKKYCDLIHFAESLPAIERDITRSLAATRLTQARVVALILRIVRCCAFRLGTLAYEAQNDSYGITTIRREHVQFGAAGGARHGTRAAMATIEFVGKKGVHNRCVVRDAVAVATLHALCTTTNTDPHVMQYELAGTWHHVRHTDVNRWLHRYGENITSKDFRTWDACTQFIDRVRGQYRAECESGDTPRTDAAETTAGMHAVWDPVPLTEPHRKRVALSVVRDVAAHVHNTPAVCRVDYIDPEIIEAYISHPVRYRRCFITPGTPARNMLLAWLRSHCE